MILSVDWKIDSPLRSSWRLIEDLEDSSCDENGNASASADGWKVAPAVQILDEDLLESRLPGGTCNVASKDALHDDVARNLKSENLILNHQFFQYMYSYSVRIIFYYLCNSMRLTHWRTKSWMEWFVIQVKMSTFDHVTHDSTQTQTASSFLLFAFRGQLPVSRLNSFLFHRKWSINL